MTTATESKAIPLREVAAMFDVTPQTIRLWVKRRKFPPPLPMSPRKLLWSPGAVEKVLRVRFEDRGEKAKKRES